MREKMIISTATRASLALLIWIVIALGMGYYARQSIENIFGADTWWLVTGWIGVIVGLVHFLVILVLAHQPQASR